MKKFIKCLMVLVLSLCFFGCKNDFFDATISGVCYTSQNPYGLHFEDLEQVSDIQNGVNYYLVADFNQPNMDAVKLILRYYSNGTVRESQYTMTPEYEQQMTWWSNVHWDVGSYEYNKELTFYLEDGNGNRSNPYTLHVNLWP